jgi:hypothetical protein
VNLEQLLLGRIMTANPRDSFIVERSFPITHFGHLEKARVATIGINPSVREFFDGRKTPTLLDDDHKRVLDRDSIGIRDHEVPSIDDALKVLASYNGYFETPNYYSWFKAMQKWALDPLAVSYVEGTVAHLDLVQWATKPVWGGIESKDVREQLVLSDSRFLSEQIRMSRPELVLFNGSTVVNTLKKFGHFVEEQTGEIPGSRGFKYFIGRCGDARAIGWSLNIQSQPDPENQSKKALQAWLTANASI